MLLLFNHINGLFPVNSAQTSAAREYIKGVHYYWDSVPNPARTPSWTCGL